MKAAARLHYLALGCAVAPVLLVAVSCGDDGGEPLATATPLASPADVTPTPTVIEEMWSPPADLPFIPFSESDALWRDIWTNAVLVEPVLRPTYLPPSLTWFRGPSPLHWYGTTSFAALYSDSEDQTWLMLEAGAGEKAWQPGSRGERAPVRDTLATYVLWDPAAPTGDASLCWDEPGSWGKPGSMSGDIPLPWDHVGYCIVCKGLPKEELIRVAEALRPVESLMAVPTRVPFVPVMESEPFWQRVAATATSIDPILRPTYLPSSITRVWPPDVSTLTFRVVYSDSTGQTWLSVSAGALNANLPFPNGLAENVEVSGLPAGYGRWEKAEPLGHALVLWEQPGRLGEPGRPSGPQLDHVSYVVGSTGLPKEELLKVANGLEPVER